MDDRLAHLSKVQIEELIERYYNKEKVKTLIEEYEIDAKPSQLIKLFPPKVSDEICPYCDINLVIKRNSRDYYWGDKTPKCPECGHENSGFCWCSNCREREQLRAQNERQEKQALLDSILYIEEENKVDFDDLSFEEKIYLGAFLREGISEDFNYIRPIESFINPLAPTHDYTSEILDILRKKKVDCDSPEF